MKNGEHRSRTRTVAGSATLGFLGMAVLFTGCGRGAGAKGSAGAAGAPGSPPPINTSLNPTDNLPGVQGGDGVIVGVSNGSGGKPIVGGQGQNARKISVGDTLSVTFNCKLGNGTALPLSELDYCAIMVSGPTFNYQRVIALQTDVRTRSVKNADGSWTYTFAAPIPATYLPPDNDSASFGAGDGELQGQALLSGTYTVGLEMYKNYTVSGKTYHDVANATKDFLLGGATILAPREVVKIDNCNVCHVALQIHDGIRRDTRLCVLCHTSGSEDMNDPATEGGTPGVSVDFRSLIHKIHNGKHLPSVQGVGTNPDGTRSYLASGVAGIPNEFVFHDAAGATAVEDYSDVNFPVFPSFNIAMPRNTGYSALDPDTTVSANKTKDDWIRKGVVECSKCHGDPDGAGPMTAPSQGDVHKTQPSRRACGACHDDVDFTLPYTKNGQTMPAQADDASCNTCHPAAGTAISVTDAHLHPMQNPAIMTDLNLNITALTGGTSAGGNFQAGDSPSLTFTVKDDAGTDVSLASLSSTSMILLGPTKNRQIVMPYPSPNGVSISAFDFAGRLHRVDPTSTAPKGTMSKVCPSSIAASETLIVEFTSATNFTVSGTTSGFLGAGALPAARGTNRKSTTISNVLFTAAAVPQTISVDFTSDTTFTVTGSVSGPMGGGTLPASINTVNRFTSTDGSVAFDVTVSTVPLVAGDAFQLSVFQGGAANPVLFAIIAADGASGTAFSSAAGAPDRFYYEVVKTAASYTRPIPMDLVFEYLGSGTGVIGQTLTAGNLPVYYGRQLLYEVTATTASGSTLSAASAVNARYVDITAPAVFGSGGPGSTPVYAVIDSPSLGVREYAQVGFVESATRIWFKTPLRYAHAGGAKIEKATLSFRQEGAANKYTLNSATGTVTSVAAFGAGKDIVLSYRTDGRFGWFRHNGDTLQTTYMPPINDSPDQDETWGDWSGKTYEAGTYTAAIWGSQSVPVPLHGETQSYSRTAASARQDFLYGTATTIEPYALVSSRENCYACHNNLWFHGSGRHGFDECVLCHGMAGAEDWPRYATPSTDPLKVTAGVTINFRTMLHKIHMGEDLANASTYTVLGNNASLNLYSEVVFPPFPGHAKHCDKCHGTATVWYSPTDRDHSTQQTKPVRIWRAACGACHDSAAAAAHIDLQTSAGGTESCAVCHGTGADFDVQVVHKNR